ncbi:hypothetical protein Tco_1367041 [Tanacetum coccineum]
MSSITAQQTKLDLELVPKEKSREIGKCNGRLNPGKKQRESTFQVVLDALALTSCYSAFLTTVDVPEVYIHQFWDTIHKYGNSYRFRMDKKKKFDLNLEIFRDIFQICPRVHGQNFNELPTDEDIVSFFKELGHTREIKSITDVVVDHMHQPWRNFASIINRSLSGKTTGLDKLRLYRAQIFWRMYYKKNVDYVELLWEDSLTRSTTEVTKISPEEPTRKSKRVKRPAKKSTIMPTAGVVIRETPVMSLSKKKEKVTVEKCKGIDLLSEVALTEEAQYEEVRKKSLRDFYKTHPSGSGTVTKIDPSTAKIKPSVTNKGTGAKPGLSDMTEEESTERSDSEHETNENESGSESNQEKNEEDVEDDEEEKDDKFVKTLSNYTDDEDETNVEDKIEGDEDKGMDHTTYQFDDDVDVRLNKPVNTDEGLIQKEGTDAEMINVQQGNENLEITLNQVVEDAHVTLSTIAKKTEVPVTSSSHSSDLASKFLKFSDIPHTLFTVPVPVTHSLQYLVSALEKEVVELKKNGLLNTQVTALVDKHLDSRIGATRDEFMS